MLNRGVGISVCAIEPDLATIEASISFSAAIQPLRRPVDADGDSVGGSSTSGIISARVCCGGPFEIRAPAQRLTATLSNRLDYPPEDTPHAIASAMCKMIRPLASVRRRRGVPFNVAEGWIDGLWAAAALALV
jgi:hypothetical protein